MDFKFFIQSRKSKIRTRSINHEWRRSRYHQQPRHHSDPDIMSDLIRLRGWSKILNRNCSILNPKIENSSRKSKMLSKCIKIHPKCCQNSSKKKFGFEVGKVLGRNGLSQGKRNLVLLTSTPQIFLYDFFIWISTKMSWQSPISMRFSPFCYQIFLVSRILKQQEWIESKDHGKILKSSWFGKLWNIRNQ